jgi:membrane protease YdiL (CAAX protease family)
MLLSSLLVPWLYPLFESWFGATPDRSLYRFAMFLGLLGMPFLLRMLQLRDRVSMGFAATGDRASRVIGRGLLYGALILVGLIAGHLLSGAHQLRPDVDITAWLVIRTALSGLASGLAVGLIEEFFFRGPMQSGARRTLSFWPAAIAIGAFYSAVHFIRPPRLRDIELDTAVALQATLDGLSNLAHLGDDIDRFVALLVAGVFLSMVRERTGSILLPIGIHAGWVMVIKVSKRLTEIDPDAQMAFLASSDRITGWLSAFWMCLIAAVYWWWSDPRRQRPAA